MVEWVSEWVKKWVRVTECWIELDCICVAKWVEEAVIEGMNQKQKNCFVGEGTGEGIMEWVDG